MKKALLNGVGVFFGIVLIIVGVVAIGAIDSTSFLVNWWAQFGLAPTGPMCVVIGVLSTIHFCKELCEE